MVNRGTEAYDLSLFEEKPAKVVKLKNKKIQKEQKKRNAIQSALNTIATICVAAMAVTVIGMMICSRVRLTELDDQINKMEQNLVVLQSENIRLTDELAGKTSTKSVEEYAYDSLGMQKIEPSQIEYIKSDNSDKAVVAENSDKNFFNSVCLAVVNFFTQLAYLFE